MQIEKEKPQFKYPITCPKCQGSGKVHKFFRCPSCGGKTYIMVDK